MLLIFSYGRKLFNTVLYCFIATIGYLEEIILLLDRYIAMFYYINKHLIVNDGNGIAMYDSHYHCFGRNIFVNVTAVPKRFA